MIYDSIIEKKTGGNLFCRRVSTRGPSTLVEWVDNGSKLIKTVSTSRVKPTPGLIDSGWAKINYPSCKAKINEVRLAYFLEPIWKRLNWVAGIYIYLTIAIIWRLFRSYMVIVFLKYTYIVYLSELNNI